MRKAYLMIALVTAVFASGFTSVAGQGAALGEVKIGFINTSAILQGTAEGKQVLQGFESFVASKRKELETLSTELDTLRRDYNSKLNMLNPTTAAEMQRTIAEKDRALRRRQEDMEGEVNQRQSETLAQMSEKIQTVVVEYAEQNGFGVVFMQTPNLPYFSPALDLTATIIRVYDEKNPAGGAAPAQ